MSNFDQLYQQGLYLSPNQQDLLLAALSSNNPPKKQSNQTPQIKPDHSPDHTSSNGASAPPSGNFENPQNMNAFGFGDDESPFLDFNGEVDFEFPGSANLIGDLPGSTPGQEYDPGEKRKSMDGQSEVDVEETGRKRRDSEAKKPGRKPLTSEPTTKRKAQNRAAQRAFRERKEKHLKDLETKVEELQSSSDTANQENGLLRAQVERLQVELREYRKRLSWMSSGNSALSAMTSIPSAHSKGAYGLQNNDFFFDFPKFGDLPGSHLFNSQEKKTDQTKSKDSGLRAPGVLSRENLNGQATREASRPAASSSSNASTPGARSTQWAPARSNGTASSNASVKASYNNLKPSSTNQDSTNSASPSSSSDSHQSQLLSSNGTSPEPSLNSPDAKHNGGNNSCSIHGGNYGEESFCAQLGMACGNINNPVPAVRDPKAKSDSVSNDQPPSADDQFGLEWLTQQNGGQFDPVLFGDWREPQDAVLSQDFGSFFNEAFPLPDLGSPSHNLTEAISPQQQQQQQAPKKSLIAQIDSKQDEEVVPGEDKAKMLSCTKIWDRLQSMEKFRNGEIDVDNLCSELRTKARCSEGGVVVDQTDVDDIMGRAK
ncbi:AP-1-like transcription factor napA [Penicillium capsulatum]|uniref:AP-1-like transcription factor napA n=1 Tax=Penicillium capsulatum TaxID=69766 RepID=A0A9W9LQX3_9EURO|nr:AP-1-like transcription factor napA [Penicillium capsulatum]KAJ6136261.1 AP-1-like transcription factor napA [Penicillium capsulatum]